MASGLASTTRFIGIIAGVAGLGAVLSAVAESHLQSLGTPLVPDHAVDWHGLSLRIGGGPARCDTRANHRAGTRQCVRRIRCGLRAGYHRRNALERGELAADPAG